MDRIQCLRVAILLLCMLCTVSYRVRVVVGVIAKATQQRIVEVSIICMRVSSIDRLIAR